MVTPHLASVLCVSFSVALALVFTPPAIGFANLKVPRTCCGMQTTTSFLAATADHKNASFISDEDVQFLSAIDKRANEIEIESSRKKLEDANTQSFLKRRPRKLPYADARIWIQRNLGPATEEEFYDLVENGNLRTPYIPKRPEEYYTRTREWISWDHFLTDDAQLPSAIGPQTGVFD